jgi:hypothetical protein
MFVLHRLKDDRLHRRWPLEAAGLPDAFGNIADLSTDEVVMLECLWPR